MELTVYMSIIRKNFFFALYFKTHSSRADSIRKLFCLVNTKLKLNQLTFTKHKGYSRSV